MAPSLRRNLLRLALVVTAASTTGCVGLLANVAAGMDMAAGTQYYDFSESWDHQITCYDGAMRLGYLRTYHGIASNNRYVYFYNGTSIPITVTIKWSDGTQFQEYLNPRSYSSRDHRWPTITGQSFWRAEQSCPPRR